jgi:RimJ/RimL family protein N-acetyltransferase
VFVAESRGNVHGFIWVAASDASALKLVELTDEDIAAMLRADEFVRPGLRQPPGGVDDPEVLSHVRQLATKLRHEGYSGGHWMMIADSEVVGLCGFKAIPTLDGAIELGYGVAVSRQRLGHATLAKAALSGLGGC